jgi:hypothetical protein
VVVLVEQATAGVRWVLVVEPVVT